MGKEFVKAGTLENISDQRPLRFLAGDTDVVVFQSQREFFAAENSCPHQHFSLLHQGELHDCTVTCPMHGWKFDLRTGNAMNGNGKLRMFSVDVRGKEIWVEKPDAQKSFSMF